MLSAAARFRARSAGSGPPDCGLSGTAFGHSRFCGLASGGPTRPEECSILALRVVFILLALAAVTVGFLLPTPGASPEAADKAPQIATLDLD